MEHQPINRLKDRSGCELGKNPPSSPLKIQRQTTASVSALPNAVFELPFRPIDDGRCPDTDPNTTPEIPSRTSFVLCVVLCRFLSGASKAARAYARASVEYLYADTHSTYQDLAKHRRERKRIMFPSALASFAGYTYA